jgi:hypothetical protein
MFKLEHQGQVELYSNYLMILHPKLLKTLEDYVQDNMVKLIILNFIILTPNFIELLMDLSFKEVIYPTQEEKEVILSMVELLLIKISQELIHVLVYFRWQIVEEIPTHHNSLLHLRHVLILMVSMLYLVKLLMECK